MTAEDTIAAIATPPGTGGVCIIRISGNDALLVADRITGIDLQEKPRYAQYANFYDAEGLIIDQGLALYFNSPHSFTGEDVVELQGHGGIAVAQALLQLAIKSGARLANPGEFTQRAYLNDKIDLAQAEAIADLISAQTLDAVKAANRSLSGVFSDEINQLADEILRLRVYIEAALDFSDEEIDFLSEGKIKEKMEQWGQRLLSLIQRAQQGIFLNQGINLVLAGKPNAGKSSLLNCLLGEDRAIVTSQEGTTRDIIKETLQIDGIPINVLDTAGLRESTDIVEREGIRRTESAITEADLILWLVDGSRLGTKSNIAEDMPESLRTGIDTVTVCTKSDLADRDIISGNANYIWISSKENLGIEQLKDAILEKIGLRVNDENTFTARERHVTALKTAYQCYCNAIKQLSSDTNEELVAEDLKLAHNALGEIVGKFSSDDLLGAIFSGFCVGK